LWQQEKSSQLQTDRSQRLCIANYIYSDSYSYNILASYIVKVSSPLNIACQYLYSHTFEFWPYRDTTSSK
jgi:hypothetical protein